MKVPVVQNPICPRIKNILWIISLIFLLRPRSTTLAFLPSKSPSFFPSLHAVFGLMQNVVPLLQQQPPWPPPRCRRCDAAAAAIAIPRLEGTQESFASRKASFSYSLLPSLLAPLQRPLYPHPTQCAVRKLHDFWEQNRGIFYIGMFRRRFMYSQICMSKSGPRKFRTSDRVSQTFRIPL